MGLLDSFGKWASPGCPRCGRSTGAILDDMRGEVCSSCNAEMMNAAMSASGPVQCARGHSSVNMLPSARSGSSVTFVCPQCGKQTRVTRTSDGLSID